MEKKLVRARCSVKHVLNENIRVRERTSRNFLLRYRHSISPENSVNSEKNTPKPMERSVPSSVLVATRSIFENPKRLIVSSFSLKTATKTRHFTRDKL